MILKPLKMTRAPLFESELGSSLTGPYVIFGDKLDSNRLGELLNGKIAGESAEVVELDAMFVDASGVGLLPKRRNLRSFRLSFRWPNCIDVKKVYDFFFSSVKLGSYGYDPYLLCSGRVKSVWNFG
ncbi:hypothetical protein I3842_12G062400 [Carya illinoinensis]|uniref:Uncharacterized protein n=1 Tax=Carya illinoinensis TaxID=32201 RepID=A0A922DHB2_CARIL|nr:hypothetical protein I3842_12G062400 [Carya illinoinensis]